MNVQIENSKVKGLTGQSRYIYEVLFVDVDEPQDSFSELWVANDEDDLYQKVKADNDDTFDEKWDNEIIRYIQIGMIL